MDANQPSPQELFTKLIDTYYSRVCKLAYVKLKERLTEYNLQSNKEAVEEYASEIAKQVFEITESKLSDGTWRFVDGDFTRIHQPKPRDEQPRTTEAMAVLAETAKFKVNNFVRKLATRHRLGDFGRGSKSDDEDDEFVVTFDPACGNLSPDDEVLQKDELDRVRKALAELDSKDRKIIRQRDFEELTYKEIGKQLGTSKDAARSRYLSALNKLRVILAPGSKPEPAEEVADDAVRLGEFRGRIVTKHPKPGTGEQAFIRWNWHEVRFKGADFDTLTLEQAITLLRERGKEST